MRKKKDELNEWRGRPVGEPAPAPAPNSAKTFIFLFFASFHLQLGPFFSPYFKRCFGTCTTAATLSAVGYYEALIRDLLQGIDRRVQWTGTQMTQQPPYPLHMYQGTWRCVLFFLFFLFLFLVLFRFPSQATNTALV